MADGDLKQGEETTNVMQRIHSQVKDQTAGMLYTRLAILTVSGLSHEEMLTDMKGVQGIKMMKEFTDFICRPLGESSHAHVLFLSAVALGFIQVLKELEAKKPQQAKPATKKKQKKMKTKKPVGTINLIHDDDVSHLKEHKMLRGVFLDEDMVFPSGLTLPRVQLMQSWIVVNSSTVKRIKVGEISVCEVCDFPVDFTHYQCESCGGQLKGCPVTCKCSSVCID